MTRSSFRTTLLIAVLLAGCATPQPGPTADSSQSATAHEAATVTGQLGPLQQQALTTAEQFTEAANRGDEAGVREAFAPDARFDSVGRIYPDRDTIMNQFLIPEVLRVGGVYRTLSVAPGDGDRIVVEYEFTTAGGGQEHFTYDYLITDGLIRDVVGRYV